MGIEVDITNWHEIERLTRTGHFVHVKISNQERTSMVACLPYICTVKINVENWFMKNYSSWDSERIKEHFELWE